jgi:hypothetical protein
VLGRKLARRARDTPDLEMIALALAKAGHSSLPYSQARKNQQMTRDDQRDKKRDKKA